MVERLKAFSLSKEETLGVDLREEDIQVGVEEGKRSLIGRVFGDKKANFLGLRTAFMKLWQYKGLCKVIALGHNAFQFIFPRTSDREAILEGKPWFFDNQLLILHPWSENLSGEDACFQSSPMWIQVWQIPSHWIFIETGRKIGMRLGTVLDVLIPDTGGKETRHLKLLVELDLTKPVMRGTRLRFKQNEIWVEFKYEQMPTFCFYCGCVGHNERVCTRRKEDLGSNCLKGEQYGPWLRAGYGLKKPGGPQMQREAHDQVDNTTAPGLILEGEDKGGRAQASREKEIAAGEEGPGGGLGRQQDIPTLVMKLPELSLDTLAQDRLASPSLGKGDAKGVRGTNTEGEEGWKVELGKGDLTLLDVFDQSLQGGKHYSRARGVEIPQLHEQQVMPGQKERKPLANCTNKLQDENYENMKASKVAAKGKWKRLARLQGQQAMEQEVIVGDNLGDLNCKRGRAETELTMDAIGMNQPEKKMKGLELEQILHNTEVEETSLNWSRPIR